MAPTSPNGLQCPTSAQPAIDIAVCLAAYNRRERTLACLSSLFSAELPYNARLTVFLLDDKSTDGTEAAVESEYPQVKLLRGSGACYWAGGMRRAYGAALEGAYSHFIWLNDDVELSPDALVRLFKGASDVQRANGGDVIVVSAMRDQLTGTTTYSGLVGASRLRPWKLKRQEPDMAHPIACDTLNGNLVLIPRGLALRLGNIDPHYTHAYGDIDYGFRARRAGASIWLTPGYGGTCSANTSRPRWKRPGLSLAERFRMINSPLGLPMKDQLYYAFRHFGLAGPLVFVEPYLTLTSSHFWPARS